MKQPFLLIPPFPSNETINSLLERVAGYNYGGTLRAECIRILSRTRPLLDTAPCSVHRFCQAFGRLYGDEIQVIHEHTLFDFYACGVAPKLLSKFWARLISDSSGPLRPSRLPLLFGCSEQECLHCIDCDEQSLRKQGFAFAYRQHTAPFVEVCPWHGGPLRARQGKLKHYDNLCRAGASGDARDIAEFSLRTAAAIGALWENSSYRRDALIRQLVDKQWVSESGRCAASAFLLAFHKRFDRAFRDQRLCLLCSEPQYAEAALRAVLRSERNVHPVWCVLFKWLVDEAGNTSPKPKRSVRPLQTAERSATERQLVVLRSAPSIRQASVTLGISVYRLLRLARQYEVPYKSRPKQISEKDKKAIIDSLAAGRTASEIADAYKVSLSTVYRFLPYSGESKIRARALQSECRLEAARKNWLAALERYPDSTVTAIRQSLAADWSYLYRHDPEWLRTHSPSRLEKGKRRRQGIHAVLVAEAVRALTEASESCGPAERVPVRRTVYRLNAITGLTEYQLSKLLSSTEVKQLGLVSETHSSFVARRLQWLAAADTRAVHVPTWRLSKVVGLRSCSVTSVLYSLFQVACGGDEGND